MTERTIADLRKEIRRIDGELVRLLNGRASLALKIGQLKQSRRLPIYDPVRESLVYRYVEQQSSGPIPAAALRAIFSEIFSASRALQGPVTVAFLGPETSFSQLAARSHFGSGASYAPIATISDVFDVVEKGQARYGVVPAENSLEGSVKITLDRLIATPARIVAEIYHPISHALLSNAKDISDIQNIYSHPQALAQCREWLRINLPSCSCHEASSTSDAAAAVIGHGSAAAIGSIEAADRFGLSILARGIQDQAANTTRFLVIGDCKNQPTGMDKTSILFAARHEPGALHHALKPFADRNINLCKILSHPVRERIWEYLFFVDFAGHELDNIIQDCLKELDSLCTFLKVLGSYPAGRNVT